MPFAKGSTDGSSFLIVHRIAADGNSTLLRFLLFMLESYSWDEISRSGGVYRIDVIGRFVSKLLLFQIKEGFNASN